MKTKILACFGLLLTGASVFASPEHTRPSVFVTIDNANGTNLLGSLDLGTGKFTEIAQTTPLFYALTVGPEDRLYGADVTTGALFTLSKTGVTTPYGSVTAPGFQSTSAGYGFLGLVYRDWEDHFLAVNVDPVHVSLYGIGKHGTKLTDLGVIEGPNTGVFFPGSLVYGPRGQLYFDFVPLLASGQLGNAVLLTINEATGAPTPVGKGLGTDFLTLVYDGNTLYGIDGDTTMNLGIYIIDVKTGVAKPTGVKVRGLPNTNDFYVDTAVFDPLDHDRCK